MKNFPRRAQLEDELRGVDHVGRIGRERDIHLLARIGAGEQQRQVSGVQRQHEEAEHVLPEEGGREEVLAENVLLPQGACHHDGVERNGFHYNRPQSRCFSLACHQAAQNKS